MFRCVKCKNVFGPKVSPVTVAFANQMRQRAYSYRDGEGVEKVSYGSEITAQFTYCAGCAGVTQVQPPTVDQAALLNRALGMQAHGRTCQGFKTVKHADGSKESIPCKVCERNLREFEQLPISIITQVCEEVPAPKLGISFASVAVEAMLNRSDDAEQKKMKRASADFMAAYPILKAYEQRGGGL